jgi:prolyl-tRNA editing enzyme YbaK/EbsC (Cys-tRNA(Pro) deacylase)
MTLTVDDVRDFLTPAGIVVQELPGDASTAQSAADALGTTVSTIVKSLLFLHDREPILVLVAGDRKLNQRTLAAELGGGKVRLAKPEQVLEITGYPVGGVPPVAHPSVLRTLLDRHLLEHPLVFAAAGAYNAIFPIEPRQLLELTGATLTAATE